MEIKDTIIPGCFQLFPEIFSDVRGEFVKTYHYDLFSSLSLNTQWLEEYYSISNKDVVRGLHFQKPPHDHEKLVYCTTGRVKDVIVDLRVDSPAYKKHIVVELDAATSNMMYIPRGCAHGFLVTTESATMMYKVSTMYVPEYDDGIKWDSAGINWGLETPIISSRDAGFGSLCDFRSPFRLP